MKRKNGFTLIELLAVIVILAIIALVAVPIVLNMINNAKKSAAISSTNLSTLPNVIINFTNKNINVISAIQHNMRITVLKNISVSTIHHPSFHTLNLLD